MIRNINVAVTVRLLHAGFKMFKEKSKLVGHYSYYCLLYQSVLLNCNCITRFFQPILYLSISLLLIEKSRINASDFYFPCVIFLLVFYWRMALSLYNFF